MYYVENLSQKEVAQRLSTTRSNVSRMLAAARERGIVRFQISRSLGRHMQLEQTLVEQFELREVVVLSAEDEGQELTKVGRLAGRWLEENLSPGQCVALSWGRTLQAMVQAVRVQDPLDVEVVQVGGDLQVAPEFSGHELVRTLAARAGGRFSYLHAPAILDSQETVEQLRRNPGIAAQLDKARCADLAVVGIGGYGSGFAATLLESAVLTPRERTAMDEAGLVGDVVAHFLDANGDQPDTPLRHRVLALELSELREIPTVVGVAAGAEKAAGILAAVRGDWIDTLVTDQAAAASMLHLDALDPQSD